MSLTPDDVSRIAHLARLESPWPRTLDMYLDSPDPLLPHLLAEPVAAITAE